MINLFFANGNFVNNSHGVGRRTWHPSAEQLEHLASSATIPSTETGAALCSCLAQFLFNSSQPVSPRPTSPSGLLGPPWCYDCKGVSKLRTKFKYGAVVLFVVLGLLNSLFKGKAVAKLLFKPFGFVMKSDGLFSS